MPRYDNARRRRGIRKPRETGAWLYVPGEDLAAAGIPPGADPPYYRLFPKARVSKSTGERLTGTVLVQLYRES